MDVTGLVDSKRLSATQRQLAAQRIRRQALCWHIGWATVAEIDAHNILAATLLAMRNAISGLQTVPSMVLVDGNRDPDLGLPGRCVIGGDNRYAAIAAASILAKVARDRYMRLAAQRYPGYGFTSNKGYGSRLHLQRLQEFGACPLHRRSFAPVARVL